MESSTEQSIAAYLDAVDPADRATLTRIFPLIYHELRQVAGRYMRAEKSDHTLQPTALVNEAFMRVRDGGHKILSERHALALGAIAMRCILVDHARKRLASKRGGAARRVALNGAEMAADHDLEILELDDMLRRYAELDPRRARVVELRFFAGMTNEEIAGALDVARSTVAEDWSVARAWLRLQMKRNATDE